jgi:circadian clock protein KaiC
MDLTPLLASQRVLVQSVDPAELSPGEFTHAVRRAVEPSADGPGARVVVIDSLNGYLHSMPEEGFLTVQLHELLTYLGRRGVVTFLILAQHGLVATLQSPIDTTYLADTIVLLRYFETRGEVRRAISVLKKRTGPHQRTIQELRLDGGISVGQPLHDFEGVLTGIPVYGGKASAPARPGHD